MIHFVISLGFMSLQAVFIIGVVFGIRKLSALLYIPKKYVLLFWMIPFFFLVFPWKITVPGTIWNSLSAENGKTEERSGQAAQDAQTKGMPGLSGQETVDDVLNIQSTKKQDSGRNREKVQENFERTETDGQLQVMNPQEGLRLRGIFNSNFIFNSISSARDLFPSMRDAALKAGEKKEYRAGSLFFCVLWAAGMFFFVMHGVLSYQRLKRKVLCSIPGDRLRDHQLSDRTAGFGNDGDSRVYYTDGIQVPIVLGYRKPCIYLPSDMEESCAEYVIAHEYTHIKRKDAIVKTAAYLITCLHWFNPAVWCAYYFMAKDMEMACDEETVAEIGAEKKKAYAWALLRMAAGKGNPFAVPPAFGKGDIKARIQNVMQQQKAAKAALVLTAAAGVFITSVFLTEVSAQKETPSVSDENTAAEKMSSVSDENTAAEKMSLVSADGTAAESGKTAESFEQEKENVPVLTFEMLREAFAAETADQLAFQKYANGKKEDYGADAPNYNLTFWFSEDGELYRLDVYCAKTSDQPQDVYITRVSDSEMAWIYTKDEDYYSHEENFKEYPNSLEIFLHTKTDIEDWLTLTLPEGYTQGSYQGSLGGAGGALIYPAVYPGKDDFVPQEWTHAGFIGRVGYAQDVFVFADGVLDQNHFPASNHSMEETVGVMDTITPGLGWQTLMVHGYHDLYTAAGLAELSENGTDLRTVQSQSEYWYFYFVKEGNPDAYYISLSADRFTKEEAISIARTVKMAEDEAALSRQKAVQQALDVYFADFLKTMTADSTKDYDRDDFAGMNGYLAAKWFEARREIYKNSLGGIHTVDFQGAELLDLQEKEGQLEVLADVTYRYAWGSSKEDTCDAGILFQAVLEPSGGTYRVVDLDCPDCAEIRSIKEQLSREGLDKEKSYVEIDRYFAQLVQNSDSQTDAGKGS